MKKSLIAFAALAAVGAASAQSSVTLYGLIDANVGKDIGSPAKRLSQGASSRLGVRGSEDLGGGMSAIFQFEHRFTPVNGQINGGQASATTAASATARETVSGNTNTFWQARSYVGLAGAFGNIRLGREYNGAFFHAQVNADPWGWDTVASTLTVGLTGGGNGVNQTNINNAITFNSASFGGLSGTIQVAESNNNGGVTAADGALGTGDKKAYAGGLSYAGGPLNIGLGYTNNSDVNNKWATAHANYNFGPAKLWLFTGKGTNPANASVKSYMVSLTAPVGAGEVRLSTGQRKTGGVADLQGVAVGYFHSLSKRTTLYVDVVNNKKATTEKNGYDFGVKHAF